MNEEEVKLLLENKFKSVTDELGKLRESGADKAELEKAIKAIETQGIELQDFMKQYNAKQLKTFSDKFVNFLSENKDEIVKIYKGGSGEIEFNPFKGDNALKVVGDMTTGSGTDEDTVPLHRGTNFGSFNLRNDNDLLSLATVSSTSTASANYTELIPKDGDYTFVAEGEEKPQIDFKWENRYPTPKKIAAYEILTEEAVTDFVRLESVAREYLKKKHDLFKVNKTFFGTGVGEEATGATVYARTFVVGAMADAFTFGEVNFMDIVNAAIADVYTTQAYADEAHYMPNLVMINPIDFFLQFQASKDRDGLPLYPQASLFNSVTIGGVTIRPWVKIPTGKIFVADMKKYNIINYVPFSIRIGWINDQFITNKFTMLGESRYFQYVKNLDQSAFIYDDLAVIQAAIEAAEA